MDDFVKKKEKQITNVWNKECEELLAEWSEKASCYRWLHGRCEKNYRKWYYSFSIPVIILSTLTGAANVGMDSFVPQESKSIASAIVGGVNILAGIISTLQNFLKVAEYMEAHRIAGVSWGKLQRNIAIELALDPCRRVIQSDFLKLSRAEYDRLIEAGPIIDDRVIKQFNNKFKNYKVSIPSICNGLDKCKIYKVDNSTNIDDYNDGIEDIIKKDKDNDDGDNTLKNIDILSETETLRSTLDDEDINLMKKFVDINEQHDSNKDKDESIGKIEKVNESLLPSKNVIITKELFKDNSNKNDDGKESDEFIKGIHEENEIQSEEELENNNKND